MTTVRLAVGGAPKRIRRALSGAACPALLISYVYLNNFHPILPEVNYRDWMMDSGAFSAHNSGKAIDLEEYISACKDIKKQDSTLGEIIALDVIGSDIGSLRNAQRMKEAGVDVVPVHHIGDDWGLLEEYCAGWDKVGLSCRFGEPRKESIKYYEGCFARQWPKKFHSFGWIEDRMLTNFPFHSGDSSSWEMGPSAFGTWKKYGKASIRGGDQNMQEQVKWYVELEERLKWRWQKEMKELERIDGRNKRTREASHQV